MRAGFLSGPSETIDPRILFAVVPAGGGAVVPIGGQMLQHVPRLCRRQLTEIVNVTPNYGLHEGLPFRHGRHSPLIERRSESCDLPICETMHKRPRRRSSPSGVKSIVEE